LAACPLDIKDAMNKMRTAAEPKRELVEYGIVELLDLAQRQGITPADFIQLLDSGMQISEFLTALKPLPHQSEMMCPSIKLKT
jgi:hypothetical protein